PNDGEVHGQQPGGVIADEGAPAFGALRSLPPLRLARIAVRQVLADAVRRDVEPKLRRRRAGDLPRRPARILARQLLDDGDRLVGEWPASHAASPQPEGDLRKLFRPTPHRLRRNEYQLRADSAKAVEDDQQSLTRIGQAAPLRMATHT